MPDKYFKLCPLCGKIYIAHTQDGCIQCIPLKVAHVEKLKRAGIWPPVYADNVAKDILRKPLD